MKRDFRLLAQHAEVLGEVNRWFCSQAHGCCVQDEETLWIYFIRNGGAQDFARRYEEAMGPTNRWFCSEHYGRDIRDPEILWKYYMARGRAGANEKRLEMCLAH